jgi:hypothetical protein
MPQNKSGLKVEGCGSDWEFRQSDRTSQMGSGELYVERPSHVR